MILRVSPQYTRILPRAAAQNLQQELQNLHMTLRGSNRCAPGVKSVPAEYKSMQRRVLNEHRFHGARKSGNVLGIVENWQPGAMLMAVDAFQSLEHFVSFDPYSAFPRI